MGSTFDDRSFRWIAHRGASADCPENTMAAFEEALRQGADAIELDVRLARDGEVVVIHDGTLIRTTGAAGHVWERSAAELAALDAGGWFEPRFRSEAVPPLRDVLTRVAPRVPINIELKGRPGVGLERAVVDVVRETGSAGSVLISSFKLDALVALRECDDDLPIGLLYEDPIETLAADARRVRASFVHPGASLVDGALLDEARALGLGVLVWTVDDPEVARGLIEAGVDGIITNRPGALRARLDSA
ncbi:MAG: glycerophosphodiester phosphodiesterase [Deltaproteobacteria bacterium]|nr:glycerophosphodiester phosphodiesterase [Deltaproteobacteria bacterium]